MTQNVEGQQDQLVVFKLNEQTFGVNITNVQEIIKMVPITQVPRTPDFVKGVINLRGQIIPVLDLYRRLRLRELDREVEWRIIVLEVGDIVVGILVDSVSEVLSISDEQIEKGSELPMGLDAKYIEGIGKWQDALIIILNLEEVLQHQGKGNLTAKVG